MADSKKGVLLDLSKAPDDIIREILKRLPASDAIRVSMTCKQWSRIVNSYSFWTQKCEYDNYLSDPTSLRLLRKVPLKDLKILIAMRAFNRNLLDDDYSLEVPKIDPRWSDSRSDRGRANVFAIESPPLLFNVENRRADLDENLEPFNSCLVSSYRSANRFIHVDLSSYGLSSEILNYFKPTIVATVYYTNRSDCACEFMVASNLLGIGEDEMPDKDWHEDDFQIDQWEPNYWRKVEHVHSSYSDDSPIFYLFVSGRDRQFWAGNYGSKIAGTSLIVKLDFNGKNLK